MILLFKIITGTVLGFTLIYGSNFNKGLIIAVVIYWIIDIYLNTPDNL